MPNSLHSAEESPSSSSPPDSQFPESAPSTTRKPKDLVAQFNLPPSPAESMLLENGSHSALSTTATATTTTTTTATTMTATAEERRLMRDIDRGAPGDLAIFSERKTPEQKEYARRKSQHYNDAFACRESNSSARERVARESIVMADVRTNVIIQDEYTFITDLSYSLSSRYQRPESSILVTVSHSACLLFGGSFDPAYTLTITALPSQVQPVTNKRNAALLQKNMEDALGVSPERGLVKFVAIAEENMATNGRTAAGEIEDLESAEGINRRKSTAINRKSSVTPGGANGSKRKSTRSLKSLKIGTNLPTHDEQMTPPLSERKDSPPPIPPVPANPTVKSALDKKAEKVQRMGKRKSFMDSILGRI